MRRRACPPSGFTLLELICVLGLTVVMASIAVAATVNGVNTVRTTAACRYLAARMQSARLDAAKRGTHVGLRFEPRGASIVVVAYSDGNGNGVRTADIARGVDLPLGPAERLEDLFGEVGYGLLDNVVDPDTGSAISGDPIRLGSTDILSFAPSGSATSGTIYVRGAGRQQCAVRVLGGTGRVRMMRFDARTRRWAAP
jgi:prepilin-type N-terminal cleavage/methylation domain-containing protein